MPTKAMTKPMILGTLRRSPLMKRWAPIATTKGAGVDKDDGTSGIRVKHSKIDARELQAEEKSYHESMKEHNVGVK